MAFSVKIKCSGELHNIMFSDDMTVSLDPEHHDEELELALVEMGAPKPACLHFLGAMRAHVLNVIVNQSHQILKSRDIAKGDYLIPAEAMLGMLVTDFVDRLAPSMGSLDNPQRRAFDNLIVQLRRFYGYGIDSLRFEEAPPIDPKLYPNMIHDLEQASRTLRSSIDFPAGTKGKIADLALRLQRDAYAHRLAGAGAAHNIMQEAARLSYTLYHMDDPVLSKEDRRAAQEKESLLQRRHVAKALTAMQQGHPWPIMTT